MEEFYSKGNTPPWLFFTFFRLYKWYQIAQSITYTDSISTSFFFIYFSQSCVSHVSVISLLGFELNNRMTSKKGKIIEQNFVTCWNKILLHIIRQKFYSGIKVEYQLKFVWVFEWNQLLSQGHLFYSARGWIRKTIN